MRYRNTRRRLNEAKELTYGDFMASDPSNRGWDLFDISDYNLMLAFVSNGYISSEAAGYITYMCEGDRRVTKALENYFKVVVDEVIWDMPLGNVLNAIRYIEDNSRLKFRTNLELLRRAIIKFAKENGY